LQHKAYNLATKRKQYHNGFANHSMACFFQRRDGAQIGAETDHNQATPPVLFSIRRRNYTANTGKGIAKFRQNQSNHGSVSSNHVARLIFLALEAVRSIGEYHTGTADKY
jgi:hypothetical protein